jgi:hypothetical protein
MDHASPMPDSLMPVTESASQGSSLGQIPEPGVEQPDQVNLRLPVNLSLPLLLAALMLLQYSGALHSMFKGLGRYQGIPATIAFLGVVTALLLAPVMQAGAVAARASRMLQGAVLLAFAATSAWTYLRGSLQIGRYASVVLALAAALAVAGWVRRECIWIYAAAAVVFLAVSHAQISTHPFDEVFKPGRPIWNIRHAVERLLGGTWVYEYHYGLSLGYLPTLALPYLPFGALHLDLRWVSVTGMLVLLAMFHHYTRRIPSMTPALTAAVVLLSPAVVYAALTTQVVVYWCYLLVFAVGLALGKEKLGQTGLIFSVLARQLAWPMVLPWLITLSASLSTGRNLRSIGISLRAVRIRIIDAAAILATLAAIAVSPWGFLWSVFVLASADASKGSASMPQPVSALALTPLFPFARHSLLVLGTQGIVVLALAAALYKTGFLHARPLRACTLIYMAFLSLNVLVYDYYWVDVIVLALAAVLLEGTGSRTDGNATEEALSILETASRTNASLQTLARSTRQSRLH